MFRVELKVKNAKLYNAITRDHATVNAFCSAHGLSPGLVGELLNFKISPMDSRWQWRKVVHEICEITGELPEDLFPEHMRIVIERNTRALELNEAQVMELADRVNPVARLESSETKSAIENAIAKLKPRERQVLMLRFGLGGVGDEMTLDEVGARFGVNRERIRQIEAKGLRALRHPSKARPLFDAWKGPKDGAKKQALDQDHDDLVQMVSPVPPERVDDGLQRLLDEGWDLLKKIEMRRVEKV